MSTRPRNKNSPERPDPSATTVLDPRLRTMGYGRRFLSSLPPAPVVHDLASIEEFFD